MKYRKMPNEHFEFNADSLSYNEIEDKILRYYDLGYANSSDFMELEEGISSSHYIAGTNGIIEFSVSAVKIKDGNYLVTCYPSSVKRKIF